MKRGKGSETLGGMGKRGGFFVSTYSPGDGATRYRFYSEEKGYHDEEGDFTALGFAEALAYARGRLIGFQKAVKRTVT